MSVVSNEIYIPKLKRLTHDGVEKKLNITFKCV